MERYRASLQRLLTENVVPFWFSRAIDATNGGYRLNHDTRGRWRGPAPKRLVTQARTLWFFARLSATSYGNPEHLDAARHGFRFLRERMWDEQFGGFFWEVDATGTTPTHATKHVYAQAFGLFAISRYAMAADDVVAYELARTLFELLESRGHDARYGGYVELFGRAWDAPAQGAVNYVGGPPDGKSMNTHLHLLEALSEYYRATGDPRARERIVELLFVQSSATLRKRLGACTECYAADWAPLTENGEMRVSFGHNVENVSLMMDAAQSAGICDVPLLDAYRTIFDYALTYGFDHRRGGFYASGRANERADRREKVSWAQAEGLLAALLMYRRTSEPRYLTCFAKTLDWIVRHQADWKYGELHERVGRFRVQRADKAGPWKGPYHAGRAFIECLERLSAGTEEEFGEQAARR